MRCLAQIDQLFNLWFEEFWYNLSKMIDEKMFEEILS